MPCSLEKYLLTITGTVTFSFLIPVSCLLYVLYVLFDWKSLRLLAARLTAFGLLIFLVIPASVYVSDLIEDSYQASIEATIETARDAAAELESESETAGEGEKGFFSGLISTVTDGGSGITDKVGEMVNRFMEALAVMLVTCAPSRSWSCCPSSGLPRSCCPWSCRSVTAASTTG